MKCLNILLSVSTPALEQQSDNVLLRSAAIFLAVVMIWVVLYKAVYPFFLRYYRDEFCKTIFWNLFFLYTLNGVDFESSELLDETQRRDPAKYAPGARVGVRYDRKNQGNSTLE